MPKREADGGHDGGVSPTPKTAKKLKKEQLAEAPRAQTTSRTTQITMDSNASGREARSGTAAAPASGVIDLCDSDEEEKKEEKEDVVVINSDSDEEEGGNTANRFVVNVHITHGLLGTITRLLHDDANALTCLRKGKGGRVSCNYAEPCHIKKSSNSDNWSCGYQSLMMLLSAVWPGATLSNDVSSKILDVQNSMHELWRSGYALSDQQYYGESGLVGTTSWIGTSVAWYYLIYHRVDAVIVNFITEENRAKLGNFLWAYFSGISSEHSNRCGKTRQKCNAIRYARDLLDKASENDFNMNIDNAKQGQCGCSLMPLYLQWPEHAVLVVGVRKTADSYNLLVFNPDQDLQQYNNRLLAWTQSGRPTDVAANSVTSVIERPISTFQKSTTGCQIILSTGKSIAEDSMHDRLELCDFGTVKGVAVVE